MSLCSAVLHPSCMWCMHAYADCRSHTVFTANETLQPALQLVSTTSIFPAGQAIADLVMQLVAGSSQVLTGHLSGSGSHP